MKAKQIQSYDIPLHDIKPILHVEEPSLYFFTASITGAVLLIGVIAYFLYLYFKRKNAFNIRKHHYSLFSNLDLNDTKQSAYLITTYGATFANDSDRHAEMFKNLVERLEVYKYKKDVSAFDSETKGYIELYKDMLDV